MVANRRLSDVVFLAAPPPSSLASPSMLRARRQRHLRVVELYRLVVCIPIVVKRDTMFIIVVFAIGFSHRHMMSSWHDESVLHRIEVVQGTSCSVIDNIPCVHTCKDESMYVPGRELACLRACMLACSHACVLACLRACMLACSRACMLTLIYVRARMLTCLHAHVLTLIYVRARMLACLHAHVPACTLASTPI